MNRVSTESILRDLVAIRSVTGDFDSNNAGLTFIESYLKERGMHIHRQSNNGHGSLVATTRDIKQPKVMLVAHLDVVPAPEHLFIVTEKDGKLYGRGVWDMKHAIAAFMTATDLLADELAAYNFGIMIFTDDEGTDNQTEKLLKNGFSCEVAVLPDGSNDWQVESVAKGVWSGRVRIEGKSSHGSRPWEGDSASMRMVDFLYELKSDFTDHGPATNTLNIGFIQSGASAWNQLPNVAEATLDIRLLEETGYRAIKDRLDMLAHKHRAIIEEALWVPPIVHNHQHELVKPFAESIQEVTGVQAKEFVSFGASDARYFLARGIPCIVTSPPGGGRHSEEEWIDKRGLAQFPNVIKRYLEKVARVAS